MEKRITVKIEQEKYNAIVYYLEQKQLSVEQEMDGVLQKLYEKHVPAAVREYQEAQLALDKKIIGGN